jgi:hypothetical protein
MNSNNDNDTNTNLKTQNNTPLNSDDEMSQGLEKDKDKDKDIIYHVNPKGVVDKHPDLAGKVEQAYIFCKQCHSWQNLTTENSIQLRFGEFSFQKQYYRDNYFCWTTECNQTQYEKEQKQKAKFS